MDNIPAKFLRDGKDAIASPLMYIINLSLTTGTVLKDLKVAKVIPLHKKNSHSDTGNYRPLYILCIFSKILEKVVYSQLEFYLINNILLYEYINQVSVAFSLQTPVYVKLNLDKDLYGPTGIDLLDLQKVFDM